MEMTITTENYRPRALPQKTTTTEKRLYSSIVNPVLPPIHAQGCASTYGRLMRQLLEEITDELHLTAGDEEWVRWTEQLRIGGLEAVEGRMPFWAA